MGKKVVVYHGITYVRYEGRRYYQPNGTFITKGFTSLHRQIYIDNFGSIPDGSDVHHKDHDIDNNLPENLFAISKKEHAKYHLAERQKDPRKKRQMYRWARSAEGKKQLRKNAFKMLQNTPIRFFPCSYCGTLIKSEAVTQKFCDKTCKHLSRVARLPPKKCVSCGKEFRSIDKRNVSCSYTCGWIFRRTKKGI